MEAKHKILIEMLTAALNRRGFCIDNCLSKNRLEYIDWEDIYDEAVAHRVHTLVYPVVREIPAEKGPGPEILEKWSVEAMACGIKSYADQLRIGEVCTALREAGISCIVLKGMAINRCYPNPELRTMGDVDILVHDRDIQKAMEILLILGYRIINSTNAKHVEFSGRNTSPIELHRFLSDSEFINDSDVFHHEVWKNLVEVSMGNAKANVLAWDMQILHMCIHMATHLIYCGFGLRQLCDFVVVAQTKKDAIDWKTVSENSVKYGVNQFLLAIFNVCSRLFSIDIPDAFKCEAMQTSSQVDCFIDDILKAGVSGKNDVNRNAVNTIIKNMGKKEKYFRNRLMNAVIILFPSCAKLSKRPYYSYLRSYPNLLPLAWIQRIIYGLTRRDFGFRAKKEIFMDKHLIGTALERNNLLLWLNIK